MVSGSSLPSLRNSDDGQVCPGTFQIVTAKCRHLDCWHASNCKKQSGDRLDVGHSINTKPTAAFWHTTSGLRVDLCGPSSAVKWLRVPRQDLGGEFTHRMGLGCSIHTGRYRCGYTWSCVCVFLLSPCAHAQLFIPPNCWPMHLQPFKPPCTVHTGIFKESKGKCLRYVFDPFVNAKMHPPERENHFFCNPALSCTL